MNVDQLERRIEEIEQELLRTDPTLGTQFAVLDPRYRRHDATVVTLLVLGAVLLMIGLKTMSVVAWLVGLVSFVASFSVAARHEARAARGSLTVRSAQSASPSSHADANRSPTWRVRQRPAKVPRG